MVFEKNKQNQIVIRGFNWDLRGYFVTVRPPNRPIRCGQRAPWLAVRYPPWRPGHTRIYPSGTGTNPPGAINNVTAAAYTGAKAFSRVFTEALWAECAPMGIDVLHLNIGFTATPAMVRLGINLSAATAPEVVAQEGLDNITNGPIWIAGGEANWERARQRSVVDGRADALRAFATPLRENIGR